jgi:glycosyltransferase involved in cell wall biosynthesis
VKIIFVQTYPLYHDGADLDNWLRLENRDKWMPMICNDLGYEAELWGVGKISETFEIPIQVTKKLKVRVFKADSFSGKSKKHFSSEMVRFAKKHQAAFYFLKGLDGGAGQKLLNDYLVPSKKAFAFVIGGKYLDSNVLKADAILYETEEQHQGLKIHIQKRNRWPFLKKRNPLLLRLPKSMDTEQFRPFPEQNKVYDIVAMGRLIPYYKNYDALFELAKIFNIGFIGGGPMLDKMKQEYPNIDWLGPKTHAEVPQILNQGKVFFHTSLRDYFPRVISEAAACGLPVVAFEEAIKEDVLPDEIGIRLGKSTYQAEITALLNNASLIKQKATNARAFALNNWGISSSKTVMLELFNYFSIHL